ncbi:hypothetical protein F442_07037 [Phytophthora nicotianae P10297]|uniref:Uncharacterized protein n=2 Tax=Phytophthora nicotianae TaxID=4792 RepID=W2ZKS2_PHYNI|nr:hypothetical protein F442_07037 [Phytophthora nicotianae P10297]
MEAPSLRKKEPFGKTPYGQVANDSRGPIDQSSMSIPSKQCIGPEGLKNDLLELESTPGIHTYGNLQRRPFQN